ncbi:retrotransposon protein, putative, ty1-copia subclass [Tanacetum coccineum]
MKAVLRIVRYLKGTTGHGILFKSNGHLKSQLYTDADWAGDKNNRRSTAGYFTLVCGNLVTRRSKKHKVVALSSVEAEFRGITRGITEVLWIRKLLTEIGYPPQEPSKVMSDNKAAIQISENPVQHDRTKHIEVDRHFIKEKLKAKIITLLFVRSDILTKAVSERSLYECLGKLNFGDPTIQLEGEYHLQQCEFCNNECDEQHRFTRRYYLEAKMHIKKDILLKCRVLPLMSTSSCTNSTVTEACRDEIATFIGIADLLEKHGDFKSKSRGYVTLLEHPIPAMPIPSAGQVPPLDILATHAAWVKASKEIAKQKLLQTVREFHACKQEEGQSVSFYVLKMKSYIDNLERLGHSMSQNLVVSLILVSLSKKYDSFVQNYNMHGMGKTVTELHAMLKLHEQTLPNKNAAHALHAIRAGKGLRGSRKLKPGALNLYVGNGHRAVVEAIRNFHLCLPSGLVVVLNNCHFAPSITREIISVSRLYDDGFINRFENDAILVSKNNLVYFHAVLRDGIYEIDLSNSNTNDSSIHISKKRIENLKHYRLLKSTDLETFDKCVSYLSSKMARKPFSHQVERVNDLLGLIHTDVCGPFRTVSRQGASYFITFTDDFSRYGYVYFLKHKHEVFETFKVFQKEVENQLGKTIKLLRSDRRGEYMSQKFLDHLKEPVIIAHCTPLYTPQHNGVSERRNKPLLDMVCSMMSQTTLPRSFWDYALEFAARILNMVSTKKVEKTPYKVWHRQAPKLSYLKVWGCEVLVKHDTLTKSDKLEPRSIKCIFIGYPKETMRYSFYYLPENKVLVARNAEFFKNSFITQEASVSVEYLEIIQDEDTHPSENISLHHDENDQEIIEPQSDIIPVHRSIKTRHALDRMCLYIDAEEHELGDLNEPANYKATLLDPESDKWLAAINAEMQSMKDNQV